MGSHGKIEDGGHIFHIRFSHPKALSIICVLRYGIAMVTQVNRLIKPSTPSVRYMKNMALYEKPNRIKGFFILQSEPEPKPHIITS